MTSNPKRTPSGNRNNRSPQTSKAFVGEVAAGNRLALLWAAADRVEVAFSAISADLHRIPVLATVMFTPDLPVDIGSLPPQTRGGVSLLGDLATEKAFVIDEVRCASAEGFLQA